MDVWHDEIRRHPSSDPGGWLVRVIRSQRNMGHISPPSRGHKAREIRRPRGRRRSIVHRPDIVSGAGWGPFVDG